MADSPPIKEAKGLAVSDYQKVVVNKDNGVAMPN